MILSLQLTCKDNAVWPLAARRTTYAWMFANFDGFSARPVFGRFFGFFFAVLDIRANLR